MNEPSPTSKLRVELQKLNADNSLSKEVSVRVYLSWEEVEGGKTGSSTTGWADI